MSLRVLLIGPYPLQQGMIVGGVEAVVSTLVSALAANENVAQVTVLCFERGRRTPQYTRVHDKLEIRYLPGQRLTLLTRSFLEVRRARRVIAELEPDVVHGHGIDHFGYIATQISPAS